MQVRKFQNIDIEKGFTYLLCKKNNKYFICLVSLIKKTLAIFLKNEKYFDLKKDLTLNNNKLDKHSHHVCIKLTT